MIEKVSDTPEVLTLGQASCLVLGLPPSIENRKRSKELIKETKIFEVSYKRCGDPLEPFLIGKKVKQVNPFLYKSYNVTPPLSPKISDDHISIASTGSNEEGELNLISQEEEPKVKSDKSVSSEKNSTSSDDNDESHDKEIIIKFLKSILTRERPNEVHKYTFTWVDETTQLELVKSHFYIESLTAKKLETWIKESGIFGMRLKRTLNQNYQNCQFGRYLYLLKQKYRSDTTTF